MDANQPERLMTAPTGYYYEISGNDLLFQSLSIGILASSLPFRSNRFMAPVCGRSLWRTAATGSMGTVGVCPAFLQRRKLYYAMALPPP